jgi:hypothetical protein
MGASPLGSLKAAIGDEPEPVSAGLGRHPAMSESRPSSESKTDETMPAVFRAKVHPRARDIETQFPNANPTKPRLDGQFHCLDGSCGVNQG